MECPYCNYKYGYDVSIDENITHKEGGFFRLPIKLERDDGGGEEARKIFGCPKCRGVFMGDV